MIDDETINIITVFGKNDISTKDKMFFEWLKAYNWVQKAPLIELTNKSKYELHQFQ